MSSIPALKRPSGEWSAGELPPTKRLRTGEDSSLERAHLSYDALANELRKGAEGESEICLLQLSQLYEEINILAKTLPEVAGGIEDLLLNYLRNAPLEFSPGQITRRLGLLTYLVGYRSKILTDWCAASKTLISTTDWDALENQLTELFSASVSALGLQCAESSDRKAIQHQHLVRLLAEITLTSYGSLNRGGCLVVSTLPRHFLYTHLGRGHLQSLLKTAVFFFGCAKVCSLIDAVIPDPKTYMTIRLQLGKEQGATVTPFDARLALIQALFSYPRQRSLESCFCFAPLMHVWEIDKIAVIKALTQLLNTGAIGEAPLVEPQLEESLSTQSDPVLGKKKTPKAHLSGPLGLALCASGYSTTSYQSDTSRELTAMAFVIEIAGGDAARIHYICNSRFSLRGSYLMGAFEVTLYYFSDNDDPSSTRATFIQALTTKATETLRLRIQPLEALIEFNNSLNIEFTNRLILLAHVDNGVVSHLPPPCSSSSSQPSSSATKQFFKSAKILTNRGRPIQSVVQFSALTREALSSTLTALNSSPTPAPPTASKIYDIWEAYCNSPDFRTAVTHALETSAENKLALTLDEQEQRKLVAYNCGGGFPSQVLFQAFQRTTVPLILIEPTKTLSAVEFFTPLRAQSNTRNSLVADTSKHIFRFILDSPMLRYLFNSKSIHSGLTTAVVQPAHHHSGLDNALKSLILRQAPKEALRVALESALNASTNLNQLRDLYDKSVQATAKPLIDRWLLNYVYMGAVTTLIYKLPIILQNCRGLPAIPSQKLAGITSATTDALKSATHHSAITMAVAIDKALQTAHYWEADLLDLETLICLICDMPLPIVTGDLNWEGAPGEPSLLVLRYDPKDESYHWYERNGCQETYYELFSTKEPRFILNIDQAIISG